MVGTAENMDEYSPITPDLFLRGARDEGVPEMDMVDHA
ncbi:unnamed protein product, partial [Allacma fusca]